MTKRVAVVRVYDVTRDCEEITVAIVSKGARGTLGELCRVEGPTAQRSDIRWRAACEAMDRGYELRDSDDGAR